MFQQPLGGAAFKDYCSQALATGGDGAPVTFFQIQSSIQDGSKDKKVLVESEESKSKENFNSPPEDVKNY